MVEILVGRETAVKKVTANPVKKGGYILYYWFTYNIYWGVIVRE